MRLAGELVELAGMIRMAPAQALARAHVLIARGSLATTNSAEIRRFRGQQRIAASATS